MVRPYRTRSLFSLTVLATVALAGLAGGDPALAQPGKPTDYLPPELPWDGASRELIAEPGDPWITQTERSGFTRTPSYDATVEYLERLAAQAPEITLVSLGTSPERREIWMAVVDADGAATPAALAANGKPVLLAQGGIHSGEIDGKDAGLMLLRDLTVGGSKRHLLDGASLLFIPIFNVDGHERGSPFNRMNQRGPGVMGWRTTSRNLNLNRDYAKADSPEMQALVAAIERWQPDLYLDLHVTDGADYQYDITYGFNGRHAWSPAIAGWLEETLSPALDRDLAAKGHVPGPLVFLADPRVPERGMPVWTAGPRFSTGYGDARHLPTVLVENHSLKPYEQRVLGTYVLLESALETLAAEHRVLERAVAADRARRPDPLVLAFGVPADMPPRTIAFAGVEMELVRSSVSGALYPRYTGRPVDLQVPVAVMTEPTATVSRPAAYWIPPAWAEVIMRLASHGIRLETQAEQREIELEVYLLEEAKIDPAPFEGRVRASATPRMERRKIRYPAGSARVPTDQPLGDLAMLLLEPASPDSFFQWGFFHEVLQRIEYAEPYVLEPLAEAMLASDPELAAAFEAKLLDPEFAADPAGRLEWFYRRSPFYDQRYLLYPVGREPAAP